MTETASGKLVWSENFDSRTIEGPLKLQSEIAGGLVAAIDRQLLAGRLGDRIGRSSLAPTLSKLRSVLRSDSHPATAPTISNDALDRYMKGRHLLERPTYNTIREAIDEFMRAVEDDGNFALAYAALTDAHLNLTRYSYLRVPELVSSARMYADMAVSSDPTLAEAHEALGQVHEELWNWKDAENSYLRAIDLKPRLAGPRRWYAGLLTREGRAPEGVAQVHRAYELDPYDPTAATNLGLSLFLAREFMECLNMLAPVAEGRDAIGACHNLGDAFALLGSISSGDKSHEYYRRAFELAAKVTEIELRLRPDPRIRTPWGDKMNAHYRSLRKEFDAARPYLTRLLDDIEAGTASPTHAAMVYAAQRRPAEALDLLERAVKNRDQFVPYIKALPFFEPLRDESRFKVLIASIGI